MKITATDCRLAASLLERFREINFPAIYREGAIALMLEGKGVVSDGEGNFVVMRPQDPLQTGLDLLNLVKDRA